jgi:hypothetical protein
MMLPKEHGAYGQVSLPLVAAFGVAGFSRAGVLLAMAVVAGFLAHEPASVLLGLRGARAKRELGPTAARWLTGCGLIGAAGTVGAIALISSEVRWSIVVPIVPALVLMVTTIRGCEKSWYGEVAASLAFAGTAVPISMAAGALTVTALAVAVPFVLLFVASTLAVRVVILQVRRGGDARAAAATRRAAFIVAGCGAALLAWATLRNVLPGFVLTAAAPGLVTAGVVAARPPSPARLRLLGWTLVAVSIVTTAIVIVAG